MEQKGLIFFIYKEWLSKPTSILPKIKKGDGKVGFVRVLKFGKKVNIYSILLSFSIWANIYQECNKIEEKFDYHSGMRRLYPLLAYSCSFVYLKGNSLFMAVKVRP